MRVHIRTVEQPEQRATGGPTEDLHLLMRASEVLAGSLDWETTLQRIVRLTAPRFADFGFFDVVEGDASVRRVAYAHEDPRRQAILDQTRWVRSERRDMNLCALSSGEPGIHPDIDERWLRAVAVGPEHFQVMRDLAFQSMITVPLTARGTVLGALTLFYGDSGRHHSEADLAVALDLARRAAAALENAALFRDLQRTASQLREAVDARDRFLAIASHELKTPLTALQLQTRTLLRGVARGVWPPDVGETLTPKLETIDRQSARLEKLIAQLLEVSRITSGRLQLDLASVDVVAEVRAVVDRFGHDAEIANVELRISAPPTLPIFSDRLRIDQVITNLLSNAIKYGAGRPVDLHVRSEGEGRDACAVVAVQDRGIGIAPEGRERIFGRFERLVSGDHYGGFGLGLWIAREMTDALGGRISVESSPGQGSTFTVVLPVHAPSSGPTVTGSS